MQSVQSKLTPSEAAKLGAELRSCAASGDSLILAMLIDMSPNWPLLDDQRLGERFSEWSEA